MSFASFLRRLTATPLRRQRGARRWAFRPRLDALEDRTLPSNFTVLNLDDSGPGSLRQAVLDSNAHPGANTIDFTPGLTGIIGLSSGSLGITNDLLIKGPGQD